MSHARNVGLDHAQGEYILFFDNDDLMEKDQIEIMINAIRQQNVQLVIGKYTIISPEGEKLRDEEVNEMEGRYYASEHLKELMWILPLLDSKLFLKELIDQHQLRFAKDVYAEDLGFYLKYLALCKQVYVIPRTVCRYRKLSTGITGRRKREIVQIYDMFQDVDSFYEKISVSQSAIGALYNIKLQHYWVHFQKYIDYTDRSDRKYVFHGLADAISDTAKKGKPFLSDFSWLIYQTIRKRKRWSLLYLSNLYVNYKNSIDSQ